MLPYITRRLMISIPVLFGITIISFMIMKLAPGNPVDMLIDPNTPPELLQAKKEMLGLNSSFAVQYWQWIFGLFHGQLGYSFSSYAPVASIIGERIGPTVLLALTALIIGLLIAIPLGIASAVRHNTAFDHTMTGLAFIGLSIPPFFLGLGLIYLFTLKVHWLPTGGMSTLGEGGGIGDTLRHLILPAAVLAVGIVGKKIRYIRASMLDVLGQEYLRTARAKGVHESLVIYKHALRNALLPILTVFGTEIPVLLGGSILVEQIFQWPGIGQLTMQSILSRDYPTLMALNLVAAVIVLASNLITDILYSIADPRIQYR
ncbi:oligopeptide transport system permease protein AppB [Paenibacillus sp. CCS19]|uniref:ABC transporter permease n=1 Tax=Paenibacillus sp. CCS19 TaxID=3158387 RepID=UPI002561F373|nr:ABC transporter permease [Paenibacillus cellulosilyticus]GMK37295.1 oligopeptide transport system permease protein AppB [Paenibacillus cellulosilyticus]